MRIVPLSPMYPPRKESDLSEQRPDEVRGLIVLGFVALSIAALLRFRFPLFLCSGLGAWLRAWMISAGLKPKTQTIVAFSVGTIALSVYYLVRQR